MPFVPKNKRANRAKIAASNVEKSSNGDVIVTNLPIDCGDRCCGSGILLPASLIEYYGGTMPWQVFHLREKEYVHLKEGRYDKEKNHYYGAFSDANITIKETEFSLNGIMHEIDAGRPVAANIDSAFLSYGRAIIDGRLKEIKADPNFKLPQESRLKWDPKRRREGTIQESLLLITGYNKDKEIVFIKWRTLEPELPFRFSELKDSCKTITTFFPENEPLSRTLTDSKGRKVECTILRRLNDNQFTFRRKSDGKEFTLNFDQVSPEDRNAINASYPIDAKQSVTTP